MPGVLKIAFKIILEYWWLVAPIALFFIFRELWVEYARTKFINSMSWVFLEIRIPQQVLKTPKAMEQVLAGLHGIRHGFNLVDKWIKGGVQEWFSLEIINKEGEIHFIIRTPEKFKNLVESQFYAQYPNAEISEVEDYTKDIPSNIPSKDYDIWGTEFILTKEDAYPIKTYPYFFEEIKQEERIDPLASLSEILNNLNLGEHIWVQILIRPNGDNWQKEGIKLVEKLTGQKAKATKRGLVLEEAYSWIKVIKEGLFGLFSSASEGNEPPKKPEEPSKNLMLSLTLGQKDIISAIEKNIAKLGFETIIRVIYWAKADIFSSANKAAIVGSFKQFNTQNLNGFKPNGKITPSADYLFTKRRKFFRKVNILNNYKKRYFPRGDFSKRGFVFNIEELATIYHLPGEVVKTQTMPRIKAKKGSPPSSLPVK